MTSKPLSIARTLTGQELQRRERNGRLTTLALLAGYIIGTYFPLHAMLRNAVLAVGIAASVVCVFLSVSNNARVRSEKRSVR
jgi:hypothetical protein